MAVKKLTRGSAPAVKPRIFQPTLNMLPQVSESGFYDFAIISAKESRVLVLYGTPTRTDEAGNIEVFRNLPLCVSTEYYEDEISPVESLFDALGINMSQGVNLDSLKGKHVHVYIDVSVNVTTDATFWNGLEFEA